MILGLPLATFTFLHVLINLAGIASGLIRFKPPTAWPAVC